jgi:large subunit ribosomal protein L24
MKIKKNDQVKILSGKDKGKTGKVLTVLPEENRLLVEGLNLIKKHVRPKKQGEKGQRVEVPGKINISKVMFVCPKCGKATRVAFRVTDDKKYRVCRKCNSEV